jgi:class 3 adenylate cyclase
MKGAIGRSASAVLDLVGTIGSDAQDPTDLRVRKALLVLFSIVILPSGIFFGTLYWVNGEPIAAALPFAYSMYSLLALVAFHYTRSFTLLRRAELGAILVTPFLLSIALGGLVASSGVILWAFLAPLGAIAFVSPRHAWSWFTAFLVLVIMTTPVADRVRSEPAAFPEGLILTFMALNIIGVSFAAFFLLAMFARQRQEAQQRADGLLLNILPASVAERLKVDQTQIAEHHDAVSVLFADVVDFTPMSAGLTPAEVVGILDRLFSDFDGLVDGNRVEKIKTIGDAYMVAAGVPEPRSDHATVMATLALEMCTVAARHRRGDGALIRLRIGINSGPVVAGVIGRRKFIYDLWGDTVNIASRMESQGVPDRIQIAEPTFALIKDAFICEPRGEIEVKGKGTVRTWFLVGPRAADTAAANSSTS